MWSALTQHALDITALLRDRDPSALMAFQNPAESIRSRGRCVVWTPWACEAVKGLAFNEYDELS